jgi:tetratricopeptide (TPR) repeat protein
MPTLTEALKLAIQHQQGNRLREAEQLYRQVLENQPNQPDALHGLALLAQQQGQYQSAKEFLKAALQVQPESVKHWFILGNLHQAQGEFAEAVDGYRQALALRPEIAPIYNNLGYALQQLGNWEEAIASYQKALELQPDCPEADVNWGNALYVQGKLSPEQQAQYAQLNYKLGLERKKAGDLNNAIVYYRQAIVMQPEFWEAHYNLGIGLREQGKFAEAIASYEQALALNPHNWEIYNRLGQIYQAQNDLTEAVAIYRQGLTLLNPQYAQAVAANPSSTIQTTPPIPQGAVTVGAYQFPAIPPVPDPDQPRPFWTVVMPIYNRCDYILECLASLLLQWSGKAEMEILVIDNASTSPIYELVNSLGGGIVHYYRNAENIGPTSNMNVGISLSRGEWVHVLHDDDSVFPGFYFRLQQSLKDCSDTVGAACTGFEYMNEKSIAVTIGEINSVYGQYKGILPDWRSRIGVCGLVMTPALVIRRATHERLGGYSSQIPNINDWELHKRIAAFYQWWYEPEILARFRVHSQSGTSHSWNSGEIAVQVRQAVEISESYLPADCCAEITAKARIQNFNYCLAHASVPLKNGNLQASLRILQSALRIDSSSQSIAKLFKWLTQEEVAPVRQEIIARLLSIPVENQKSSITTESKQRETAIKT